MTKTFYIRHLLFCFIFLPLMLWTQEDTHYEVSQIVKENVARLNRDRRSGYLTRSQTIDSLTYFLKETNLKLNPGSYAYLVHQIGNIQNDLKEAIRLYQEALEIRLGLNDTRFLADIGNVYYNLSDCYALRGELFLARDFALEGQQFLDARLPTDTLTKLRGKILMKQALIYDEIGDLDNAILAFRNLINYGNAVPDLYNQEIFEYYTIAHQALGGLLNNDLHRYDEARLLLTKSERLVRDHPNERIAAQLATTLQDIATLEMNQENYQKAIKVANASIVAFRSQPDGYRKDYGIASNYNNLSIIYKKNEDYDEAERYLSLVVALRTEEDDLGAYLHENRGDIYFLRKKYDESITEYKTAINLLLPEGLEDADLTEATIIDKDGLLTSLVSLAKAYVAKNDLKSALFAYTSAAAIIERMRQDFRPDASKGLLAKRAKPIYAAGIDVCWQLWSQDAKSDYAEQALLFSERSHSLVLNDAVNHIRAASVLPDSLAEREKLLHLKLKLAEKDLSLLRYPVVPKDNAAAIGEAQQKVLTLRRERKRLEDKISAEYPAFADYRKEEGEKTFSELQVGLLKDKSYLQYFVGPTGVFAFVLNGPEDLAFHKLPEVRFDVGGGDNLVAAISKLRTSIKNNTDEYATTGLALYEALIAPLQNDISNDQLIIIPDGPLAYLSFDMLPMRVDAAEDFVNLSVTKHCLIQDYTISYQHSLSLDLSVRKENKEQVGIFLGVNPVFANRTKVDTITVDALDNQLLVHELAKLYRDAKILTGTTLAEFLDIAGNYRIVQLESHAVANDENGELSFVLMSGDGKERFYAGDAYALRMPNTDMVVLNACQSANGELREGEGLISLSRAFFYAGARAVVPALWDADDRAVSVISADFHKQLKAGATKSEALRTARLNYLDSLDISDDRHAHPYYWAALIPVGNMEAIKGLEAGAGFGWKAILGVVVFLLGTYLLFFREKEAT